VDTLMANSLSHSRPPRACDDVVSGVDGLIVKTVC